MLAVDGHSAAGKSTFADALASRTGAVLVRGDDFYRVMAEAERGELAPAEGVDHLPLPSGLQNRLTSTATTRLLALWFARSGATDAFTSPPAMRVES